MRDYIIMTDSCCDLTAAEVSELGITVLPLSYTLDGVTYPNLPDRSELAAESFFEKLRAGKPCTTAAVNVGQFTDAMREALEAGKDILCIAFSSTLSTTYQSACIAAEDLIAEYPDAKIIVVDSLAASRGQGMLVWRAVEQRRKTGADIETLAEFVRENRMGQRHWFMVDDLNHLKRGGRVSALTALAGTALGIKPVLHVDENGGLAVDSKARGVKGALRALVDKMEKHAVGEQTTVFICHADCQDSVDYISALLRERFGVTDIRSEYIGPVIGAHTGCGTLGLFFVGDDER